VEIFKGNHKEIGGDLKSTSMKNSLEIPGKICIDFADRFMETEGWIYGCIHRNTTFDITAIN